MENNFNFEGLKERFLKMKNLVNQETCDINLEIDFKNDSFQKDILIKGFFDILEDKFNEFYTFKDVYLLNQNLQEIEEIVENHKNYNENNYNERIIQLLKSLNEKLSTLDTKTSINALKNFTKDLKNYSESILRNNDNLLLSHKKLLISEKRRKEFSTNKKYKTTTNNNFIEIYMTKENGIYSQSYFFRYNMKLKYKLFKFFKIKLYLSKSESFDKIKEYIEYVKSLFKKHIVIYKENINKNFFKIIITGSAKKKKLIINKLKIFLKENIIEDCIIKISNYDKSEDNLIVERKNITLISK